MTKPTQAQIEAAARAFAKYDMMHCPSLAEAHAKDKQAAIAAALTAAAEVGHWLDNPTAEQVEERWERCFKDAADNIRRKERAATIERCAQVAETRAFSSTKYAENPYQDIAAAIRALKEKP